MKALKLLLFPFSLIYAVIVFARNRAFDWGLFKSKRAKWFTIVIGNLTVGGTGKTPMTLYLLDFLQKKAPLALVSRGYGRKSIGPVTIEKQSTADQIGDEPALILSRMPDIQGVIDGNRLKAIDRISTFHGESPIVVLDDAFQHRSLVGDINILLTDFNHLFFKDFMLPMGGLRDNRLEKRRADVIVVTKCPLELSAIQKEEIIRGISPKPNQKVFFTGIRYGQPTPVFRGQKAWNPNIPIYGIAGIARPQPFQQFLKNEWTLKKFKTYPDHHDFSEVEIDELIEECGNFDSLQMTLVTTEKDAMRLRKWEKLKHVAAFYIPIEMVWLEKKHEFETWLMQILHERMQNK